MILSRFQIIRIASRSLIKNLLGLIAYSEQKRKKKQPTDLTKGDLNLRSALKRLSVFCMLKHYCSNELENLVSLLYIYKRGDVEIPPTKSSKQVLRVAQTDANFARVSPAPAHLHCYLLEKAQFGLLRTSPYTRLPGFLGVL